MKKLIALILVCIALFSAVSATAEVYPDTARVVKVDYETDTVTVETFNGFLFTFEGCEDYMEGDGVALIMEDNNTPKVFDDIIIKVQYCGWTLINWYKGE